jgi:hypothetical protein
MFITLPKRELFVPATIQGDALRRRYFITTFAPSDTNRIHQLQADFPLPKCTKKYWCNPPNGIRGNLQIPPQPDDVNLLSCLQWATFPLT